MSPTPSLPLSALDLEGLEKLCEEAALPKALALAGLMDEAEKVLEPFAELAKLLDKADDDWPDNTAVHGRAGMFRAARILHAKLIALRDVKGTRT